jgi:hypothetical protein
MVPLRLMSITTLSSQMRLVRPVYAVLYKLIVCESIRGQSYTVYALNFTQIDFGYNTGSHFSEMLHKKIILRARRYYFLYHKDELTLCKQLKRTISILLIAVFFTAQYARQLAYLECKLAELSTAATMQCDCEKETGIDKMTGKEVPPVKNHTHISVDEFFNSASGATDNNVVATAWVKPAAIYTKAELQGAGNTPYRPPEA